MGRAATVPEGVNWITMVALIVFHAGALAALFFFSWQRFAVAVVLYVLAINVGIGMCYHRLLTHRGYRVPKWLEYVDDGVRDALARGRARFSGFPRTGFTTS